MPRRARPLAPIVVLVLAACGATTSRAPAPPTIVIPSASVGPTIAPTPPPPPFAPPPGTIVLAVIDDQGGVTANVDAPREWHYDNIVAACHGPGRPTGHLLLALEEIDDDGTVRVKRVEGRAGLDEATVTCIVDAIGRAIPPRSLSGTLAGHSLADGGWARGAGFGYVTLY